MEYIRLLFYCATLDHLLVVLTFDFLLLTIRQTEVHNQDGAFIMIHISLVNKIGREITWNYYKENYVFNKKYEYS